MVVGKAEKSRETLVSFNESMQNYKLCSFQKNSMNVVKAVIGRLNTQGYNTRRLLSTGIISTFLKKLGEAEVQTHYLLPDRRSSQRTNN